jgi:hypothetical protein
VINIISKEKESSFKISEFPPKEPPNKEVRPTQKQMEEATRNAMKDVREIDLPILKKKYYTGRDDLSKIVIKK